MAGGRGCLKPEDECRYLILSETGSLLPSLQSINLLLYNIASDFFNQRHPYSDMEQARGSCTEESRQLASDENAKQENRS